MLQRKDFPISLVWQTVYGQCIEMLPYKRMLSHENTSHRIRLNDYDHHRAILIPDWLYYGFSRHTYHT